MYANATPYDAPASTAAIDPVIDECARSPPPNPAATLTPAKPRSNPTTWIGFNRSFRYTAAMIAVNSGVDAFSTAVSALVIRSSPHASMREREHVGEHGGDEEPAPHASAARAADDGVREAR